MTATEELPVIKGTPKPTPDRCVKGQKPEISGPSILLECHVCGYGNTAWAGYFAIPETPLNVKRANLEPNTTPIMCPACHNPAGGKLHTNEQALRQMGEDELRRSVMMRDQEIAELKRQLADKQGVTGTTLTQGPASKPRTDSVLPKSGQR